MTTLRPDARLSPESLGDAMRALARAFSAVQLYLPNNQQRAQRLADARAAFAQLWQRGEWVDIDVRENAFLFDGDVVYQDADRGAEALPWLLYRDGIRRLSVAPGFEEQELEAFLSLVQGARAASNDNDDLVTLLWIADYQCLRYHYLDSYGTDAAARVVDAAPSAQPVGFAVASIDATDDAATSSPFLSMSDFDGALYFLDAREISALQSELDSVYAEDPRKPVLDSVLDMFELPSADETRSEVFETLDRFVVELLTASEYPMVAYALRECAALVRKNELPPALSVKLGSIAHRLSEPSAMSQLLLAIDDSARTPAMALLEELFRELRPSALEPLVLWLGTAGASPARAAVERASQRLAAANLSEVSRLLEHANVGVVWGALKLANKLASPATVPGLTRILRSDDVRMRLEAVSALANVASPGAMQALERATEDADREVRVATYRTFASRRHHGALPRLLTSLRARETRTADLGEKMALFEAFGSLCGEAGIAELDGILNSRGLIGAKEPPEFRACAARALGMIGSPAAFASLQKASDTKEVVVRSAVMRAMRDGA